MSTHTLLRPIQIGLAGGLVTIMAVMPALASTGDTAYFGAKVLSKSGTSLTVKAEGKMVTVATDGTVIIGRFDELETLADIHVGDKIRVRGTFTNDADTAVTAQVIRDLTSNHMHKTVLGTLKAVTGEKTFTFKIRHKGVVSAILANNAKLIDRRERPISLGDLKAGDTIRITGVWDPQTKTFTQVTRLKDFSIPAQKKGHNEDKD